MTTSRRKSMEVSGGKGVDVVFDPVGAGLIDRYSPALARDARNLFLRYARQGLAAASPSSTMFQKECGFPPLFGLQLCRRHGDVRPGEALSSTAGSRRGTHPARRSTGVYPMEKYIRGLRLPQPAAPDPRQGGDRDRALTEVAQQGIAQMTESMADPHHLQRHPGEPSWRRPTRCLPC